MQRSKGIYPKMELGKLALIQKPDLLKKTGFFTTTNNLQRFPLLRGTVATLSKPIF
jgi:hypothetical protein